MEKHPSNGISKAAQTAAVMLSLALLTGCATSALINDSSSSRTTTQREVLLNDQVVAFAQSAQPLANIPNHSVVIVGEKHSYVLSQGGQQMVTLLTHLTPQNINVENDMAFYSANNDGYFQGEMKLSYVKLKDEFARSDYQFFLQNQGTECSSKSDERMGAQRFCFNVPIKGMVYPAVSNLSLIQAKSGYRSLSKPYSVTLYTNKQVSVQSGSSNVMQKVVMLPFALAFDVITLPVQLLQ